MAKNQVTTLLEQMTLTLKQWPKHQKNKEILKLLEIQ